MFDISLLSIQETVDQCRALILAIIEITNPANKELLLVILAEKLTLIHRSLEAAMIVER